MDCCYSLQVSGGGKRWICSQCGHSAKYSPGRSPKRECLSDDTSHGDFQCCHRGGIVGKLDRLSCGCERQDLYQCLLYNESVTIRRHRMHKGRNCLDCICDEENVTK